VPQLKYTLFAHILVLIATFILYNTRYIYKVAQ